jgi:hypothetical protein
MFQLHLKPIVRKVIALSIMVGGAYSFRQSKDMHLFSRTSIACNARFIVYKNDQIFTKVCIIVSWLKITLTGSFFSNRIIKNLANL